jgi:hypothetical protein
MAFTAKDGSKHTNHDSMKRQNARTEQAPMQKPPTEMESEVEGAGGPEPHHQDIHQHLSDMHAMTGKAHSHVEHNGDGSHTAHHVDMNGQVSGPEEHGDCPGGMCGGM